MECINMMPMTLAIQGYILLIYIYLKEWIDLRKENVMNFVYFQALFFAYPSGQK